MTGSAVSEQKSAEADVPFGVDGTSEGDAASESTKPLKTKAVPATVAGKSTGSITPEEMVAVGVPEVAPEEANIKSQPEAGPDRLGVKGLSVGETWAIGKINLHLDVFTRVGLHVYMLTETCACPNSKSVATWWTL